MPLLKFRLAAILYGETPINTYIYRPTHRLNIQLWLAISGCGYDYEQEMAAIHDRGKCACIGIAVSTL